MKRFERDPQSELVRRYARILRSAPAEATRVTTPPRTAAPAGTARAPVTPLRSVPAGPDGARSKP
jgi:hypothetical protein